MTEADDPHLLVLAAPAVAAAWAASSTPWRGAVWCGLAGLPPLAWPEVVLTDRPETLDELLAPLAQDRSPRHAPAVVRVGCTGEADACLPADATLRELQLACRLAGKVARLRAQLQTGQQLHDQLFRQALSDPLTALPNRRAWDDALAVRLAAGAAPVCLALFDIDRFKPVNDLHGHAKGDAVLKAAARGLREGLRHGDLAARLGGDEFAALIAVPDAVAAAAVTDRVRRQMAAAASEAAGFTVTVSAGSFVCPKPPPPPCPADVVATADAALLRAKQQGRDRTVAT